MIHFRNWKEKKKRSHASEYLPQTSHRIKCVWGWFWTPHVIGCSLHSCWLQQLYGICYPQTSKTRYPTWKQVIDTSYYLINMKTLLCYEMHSKFYCLVSHNWSLFSMNISPIEYKNQYYLWKHKENTLFTVGVE